jgi:hypothetical protein
MENNVWRIRYNEEPNTLLKGEGIVRYIKSQRIRWLGHVERMEAVFFKVSRQNEIADGTAYDLNDDTFTSE